MIKTSSVWSVKPEWNLASDCCFLWSTITACRKAEVVLVCASHVVGTHVSWALAAWPEGKSWEPFRFMEGTSLIVVHTHRGRTHCWGFHIKCESRCLGQWTYPRSRRWSGVDRCHGTYAIVPFLFCSGKLEHLPRFFVACSISRGIRTNFSAWMLVSSMPLELVSWQLT